MRGSSSEKTLPAKEAYERLSDIHEARVCSYRADSVRFTDPLFKEAVKTCRQQISYCGLGSPHQNTIVELRIKEFTLGSWTLLLHYTILWPEAVSTIL